MSFFNDSSQFRIRKTEKKAIKQILRRNKGLYDSESHFIRSAIIRLIKEHRKGDFKC